MPVMLRLQNSFSNPYLSSSHLFSLKPFSQQNSISFRRHMLEPSWLFSFTLNDNLLQHLRCLHFSGMPISTKWVSRVEWSSLLCLVITLRWLSGAVTQWQLSHLNCHGCMKAFHRGSCKTNVKERAQEAAKFRESLAKHAHNCTH